MPVAGKKSAGMTLTEVVVAAAIIGVVFVSFLKVTAVVAKAIQYSKFRSIAANPDSPMSNSVISGTVKRGAANLVGAGVIVAQNPGWSAITDAVGHYTMSVLPGDYTLVASMPGYFTVEIATSIVAQQTL